MNLLALLEGGRDSGTANKRSKGILHKLMYVGIAYHGLITAGLYPGITQMCYLQVSDPWDNEKQRRCCDNFQKYIKCPAVTACLSSCVQLVKDLIKIVVNVIELCSLSPFCVGEMTLLDFFFSPPKDTATCLPV